MFDPTSTPMQFNADLGREQAFLRARARATAFNVVSEFLLPATDDLAARLNLGEVERDLMTAAETLGIDAAPLLAHVCRLRESGRAEIDEERMQTFGPTLGQAHPPYSTEYEADSGFRKEQELADIGGFYAAWGVTLADDVHERADHFGIEADFLAFMALKEAIALIEAGASEVELVRSAIQRFAGQYVAPGAREFAVRLDSGCLFAPVASLLVALLNGLTPAGDLPRRRVVTLPVLA